MYVMRPASYNRWATPIVLFTLKPSFREASCCKVEVVNGAAGFLVEGFVSTEDTVCVAPAHASKNPCASLSVLKDLLHAALTMALPVPK